MTSDRARVAILADDLIWSVRLAEAVRAADAEPVRVRTLEALVGIEPPVRFVIVDLTSRAYAGVEAVRRAADAGLAVLAVGQHDDAATRRAAIAAGADRVVPYRKLHEAGPATISGWLAAPAATP